MYLFGHTSCYEGRFYERTSDDSTKRDIRTHAYGRECVARLRGDARQRVTHTVDITLAGKRPMKKAQPGVHPENEVSKCVNANSAECRPALASTERHISMTRKHISGCEALMQSLL